jgi:hypothetical protein
MNFTAIFEHPHILIIVAVISLPLYWFIGRFFFNDWQDFLDHLRLWYQPIWLSAFRGEFSEDMWAQAKLFVFLGLCFGWALLLTNFLI